jgi:hypothetical protein
MTDSDRLLEQVYALADKQPDERARLEVVRIAYLAAQHRAARIKDAGQTGPSSRAGGASSARSAAQGD